MGRYVLLEFDDNEAAETFVSNLNELKADGSGDFPYLGIILCAHAKVSAVFSRPNNLCQCKGSTTSVKGTKFGWWVCPACKKGKAGVGQPLRNMLDEGLNNTSRVGVLSLRAEWYEDNGKVVTKTIDDWKTRR